MSHNSQYVGIDPALLLTLMANELNRDRGETVQGEQGIFRRPVEKHNRRREGGGGGGRVHRRRHPGQTSFF